MRKSIIKYRILLSISVFILFTLSFGAQSKNNFTPLIFVHGGAGSASQFSSQAMRFTSNGYDQDQLFVLEYDSSFNVDTLPSIHTRLDALIEDVLAHTKSTKVDVMGHSLGTYVLQTYLANPTRTEKIHKYVNLDGYSASSLPGGIPTLALWAEIGQGGHIGGGTNIIVSGQTHVETATSAESFAHMFEFLTGKLPKSTNIKKSRSSRITLAGRAVLFPLNVGVEGSEVKIYEINPSSGQRIHKKPNATFNIDQTGHWGPFNAHTHRYYEFVIARDGQDHHIYRQPFLRDDHFIRLLTSPIGGGVGANIDVSENQTNIILSRDRELWGETELGNDLLIVNGVNVINTENSSFANRTTALYLNDVGSDGESDLTFPEPYLHSLPFISGNDFFIPASDDASGKIRINLIDRGYLGAMQEFNIPNWPSTTDRVTLQFNDYVQGDSRALGQHKRSHKKKHH